MTLQMPASAPAPLRGRPLTRSFIHWNPARWGLCLPQAQVQGHGLGPGCCLLDHPSDPCPTRAALRGPQPLTVSSLAPCSRMTVSSKLAAACARKVLVEPSPSMVVQMRWLSSANVRRFMASCSSGSGGGITSGYLCPGSTSHTFALTPLLQAPQSLSISTLLNLTPPGPPPCIPCFAG